MSVKYQTAVQYPVNSFVWSRMTVRHNNGGTAIGHNQSVTDSDDAVATKQELRYCIFRDLSLSKTGESTDSIILDIEGAKFCVFRSIIIGAPREDSGIGFRIRGSRNLLETIYAPSKIKAPGMFLDFQSSNSQISHLRTEGGSSSTADYWIHDCSNVDIQNVLSEGHQSQNIMSLWNCNGITIRASSFATIDTDR